MQYLDPDPPVDAAKRRPNAGELPAHRLLRGSPPILSLLATPLGYADERKAAFRLEALRVLKEIARGLGLAKGDFDLRWNPGGIAVSGDAILHGLEVYVLLSQGFGPGSLMFRRVAGRADYRGGPNHWANARELADPIRLADRIARELGLSPPPTRRLL